MELKATLNKITHSQNFRHGILYTVFSFLNNGISFVLILILAKYLTPSDYGHLNLYNTFVNLLTIVIALCSASFVAVSYFQKRKDELQEIIIIVIAIASCTSILLLIFFTIFHDHISNLLGVNFKYLVLGIGVCYFSVFNNLNLDIWRVEEKPIAYGIYSFTFALCNFVLTIWLIVGEHYGWSGRVYAQFLLAILYFIISVIFLYKRKYLIIKLPSKGIIRETLLFSLPLIPHNISFWLKQGMDRYILNYYYDTTIVGYFSFSMNMAAIITMIGTAFNATNSVFSFKILTTKDPDAICRLKKQAKIMYFVFSAVGIAAIGFTYVLIRYFLTQYNHSLYYILPLGIGAFFQCIYYLWVNYLVFYKKTYRLMNITLGTALIQLILSVWLTRYSSEYTAWISMCISALTFLITYVYANNLISKETSKA